MRRPLVPFLVSFILGITIGNFYRVSNEALILSLLIILILLLITTIKKSDKLITVLALTSFIILGLLNINLCLYRDPGSTHIVHHISKDKVTVEGIVSENPQEFPDRSVLIVSAHRLIKDGSDIPVEGSYIAWCSQRPRNKLRGLYTIYNEAKNADEVFIIRGVSTMKNTSNTEESLCEVLLRTPQALWF